MIPKNPNKFNNPRGKTKRFPIKQFRFDVTNSPIIKSKAKCSFIIKTILSQQEELMLDGLINSFQVPITESFRIALSKVSTIASEQLETFLPLSLAQSTHKAHQGRSRKFQIRIPKEEKETLELIARTHNLTQQAAIRLVIIYVEKSIRTGTLTKFEGCRMLSEGETWDIWSKDNPVSSGKLDALKKARDKAYDEATKRGQEHDKELYELRGSKIEQLSNQGELHTCFNSRGEVDLRAIDSVLQIESDEAEELDWDIYLNELQKKEELSDYERKIERQIFRANYLGIDITREEAIEEVKAYEERNRELTDEEQADVDAFLEWSEANQRDTDLQSIDEKLGISTKDLPKEEQDRLLHEQELERKAECKARDEEFVERQSKKYCRRFNLKRKKGQSYQDAFKEHSDLIRRIDKDGLTEEEKKKITDKIMEQSRKWEEYKKEVGYGETHD